MKSILSLFLFLPFFSFGQNLTIQITDALSSEALPYANIYCKFSGVGSSTNIEGIAYLNLAKLQVSDTLIISYIGYTSQQIYFSKEKKITFLKIELQPNINSLEQVVVTSEKPIKAKKIIKQAIKNTSKNYSCLLYTSDAADE